MSSILSSNNSSSFHELKKQASFFFKEKIKTARLALTDVTPAELLTEEATNGNPWAPETRTLGSISRAAFEVDDYWRIVGILHKRLSRFQRTNWRVSYNSLILLEHLLTHGPESVAGEFQPDQDVIREMESFQYIDEKGFNWGLTVRKKSERVLKLLQNGSFYKEERERSRKLTRGIQGFGSFSNRSTSSGQGILQESARGTYGKSNSQFNEHNSEENRSDDENINASETLQKADEYKTKESEKKVSNLDASDSFSDGQRLEEPLKSLKENIAPVGEELDSQNFTGEDNPLLLRDLTGEHRSTDEDHPFHSADNQAKASLLSGRSGILQGC